NQKDGPAGAAAGQRLARPRDRGMVGRRMALLAQQRRRLRQQGAAHRTVRRVAERAVLGDGRMLPEDGSALVGVAAEARLVQRRLVQHRRRVRAVRLWQSLQLISPKRTGWVDGFWKSPRFCR